MKYSPYQLQTKAILVLESMKLGDGKGLAVINEVSKRTGQSKLTIVQKVNQLAQVGMAV